METKNLKGIHFKYVPIDLSQDVDYENRRVRGYLSKFDILDADRDIIRKGAFVKSINERGPKTTSNRQIKFLLQHDMKMPAGVFNELYEDSKGLAYEGYIEKTISGDETLERIKIGFYREHSFGFQYVEGKCGPSDIPFAALVNPGNVSVMVENGMARVFECKELNLFEGSIVTFGANQETNFVSVKSETEKADKLKSLESLYEYLIKNAPNYEYELALRNNFNREYSLINSLAVVKDTKELEPKKEEKVKGINYNYLLTSLKK